MTVLVVGAGPTGLAAAAGLAAAGVAVCVVDAAAGPATTSRALGLQPRGVEVLDRLDALGDLSERSVRMRGTVIHVDGRQRLRLSLPSGERVNGHAALVISQTEIEAQLRQRLDTLGVTVQWGRRLAGLTQDSGGVLAQFDDGAALRADWLIGCDGGSSTVRRALGLRLLGETAEERFLLADVRAALPVQRDYGSMWAASDGTLAAIPLPGADQWRLMAPTPPGYPDDPEPDHVLQYLTNLARRRVGANLSVTEVLWTSAFRIHRRLADRYRLGRVLLAGDAAHVHSPVGGQGMNTGLGDAENLAFKLALVESGLAGEVLVDSYEAERRPVAAAVVNAVGGVDRLLLNKNPVVGVLRDRLLLPMIGLAPVQRRIWRRASQLDITYRRGGLAHPPQHPRPRLRSGDRVADSPTVRADGTSTRLHAELRGHWALVCTDPAASPAEVELVRARLGTPRVVELASSSVPSGWVLLVRPDGHLAWQGTGGSSALSGWFDEMRGR
jgi:4,5-epoxidase